MRLKTLILLICLVLGHALDPTAAPISLPTAGPIALPTLAPIALPTVAPISLPTATPIAYPTVAPISLHTTAPSSLPTSIPSACITPPVKASFTEIDAVLMLVSIMENILVYFTYTYMYYFKSYTAYYKQAQWQSERTPESLVGEKKVD